MAQIGIEAEYLRHMFSYHLPTITISNSKTSVIAIQSLENEFKHEHTSLSISWNSLRDGRVGSKKNPRRNRRGENVCVYIYVCVQSYLFLAHRD